jgi:hypothetical protein
MIRSLFRIIFKLAGICGMGYSLYIIVWWYINWLSYYFIGNLKISILAGLVSFFMAPIAGVADIFWHSLTPSLIEMWKWFLIFFLAGRFLFFLGEKLDNK